MASLPFTSSLERIPSALSPGVKRLLCEIGLSENDAQTQQYQLKDTDGNTLHQTKSSLAIINNNHALDSDSSLKSKCVVGVYGFLELDECASLLPNSTEVSESSMYYEKAVSRMSPIYRWSLEILEDLSNKEFQENYGKYFEWTKNPSLVLDCFELLTHKNGADDLLALLLLCGVLERGLGNVYLLRGSQCPAMLKDLLATSELTETIGSAAIRILQVVIGPPVSMNLRNVAWHGFLSENELPRRYIYFLILLTASLGKTLEKKGINPGDIRRREFVPLTKTDEVARSFPEITRTFFVSLEKYIVDSWIINEGNINIFKSATSFYEQQKFGWSAVQLFPLLEHALRRLFVWVNNCPDRLNTAEATTLYTTFEEILDCHLFSGEENALVKILGEPCMDLLHDLLIYPLGPRARDKLGHGEADYMDVPQSLSQVLMCLFGYLAVKTDGKGKKDATAPVQAVIDSMEGFKSVFHPISVLHDKILKLASQTAQLHVELTVTPSFEQWTIEDGSEVFTTDNETFTSIRNLFFEFISNIFLKTSTKTGLENKEFKQRVTKPFQDITEDVKKHLCVTFKTLYRWQSPQSSKPKTRKITESEIVGLLSRIIHETKVTLTQTKSALMLRQDQLINKQLRSRQRDNMKRLLAFMPCASLLGNYVSLLSTWITVHLDDYKQLDEISCKVIQSFLKCTLQTCENMRTFTSVEKNKWSQAGETTLSELTSAVVFSNKLIFSAVTKGIDS